MPLNAIAIKNIYIMNEILGYAIVNLVSMLIYSTL